VNEEERKQYKIEKGTIDDLLPWEGEVSGLGGLRGHPHGRSDGVGVAQDQI